MYVKSLRRRKLRTERERERKLLMGYIKEMGGTLVIDRQGDRLMTVHHSLGFNLLISYPMHALFQ